MANNKNNQKIKCCNCNADSINYTYLSCNHAICDACNDKNMSNLSDNLENCNICFKKSMLNNSSIKNGVKSGKKIELTGSKKRLIKGSSATNNNVNTSNHNYYNKNSNKNISKPSLSKPKNNKKSKKSGVKNKLNVIDNSEKDIDSENNYNILDNHLINYNNNNISEYENDISNYQNTYIKKESNNNIKIAESDYEDNSITNNNKDKLYALKNDLNEQFILSKINEISDSETQSIKKLIFLENEIRKKYLSNTFQIKRYIDVIITDIKSLENKISNELTAFFEKSMTNISQTISLKKDTSRKIELGLRHMQLYNNNESIFSEFNDIIKNYNNSKIEKIVDDFNSFFKYKYEDYLEKSLNIKRILEITITNQDRISQLSLIDMNKIEEFNDIEIKDTYYNIANNSNPNNVLKRFYN